MIFFFVVGKASDLCSLGSCSRSWRELWGSDPIWERLCRVRWSVKCMLGESSASELHPPKEVRVFSFGIFKPYCSLFGFRENWGKEKVRKFGILCFCVVLVSGKWKMWVNSGNSDSRIYGLLVPILGSNMMKKKMDFLFPQFLSSHTNHSI